VRIIAVTTSSTRISAAERLFDLSRLVDQIPYDPAVHTDEWMALAVCRDEDPELFHPLSATGGGARQIDDAVAVCAGCPVTDWCRQRRYETGATGVWAGVFYDSPGGLRPCALAKCSNPVKSARAHYCGFECEHKAKIGTRAGYQLHGREKVKACAACREGNREAASLRGPDSRVGDHSPGSHKRRVTHSGVRVASR
jgi:WhiB family redox-sensing transcriptional regulator